MEWLTNPGGWTIAGAIGVLIGLFSNLAERRRNRRKDLEKVGFMPWPLIMLMAFLFAIIAFALAANGA